MTARVLPDAAAFLCSWAASRYRPRLWAANRARQERQPRRGILGLHRAVHLQHEWVGHLGQRLSGRHCVASRLGQRVPDLPGQPGEHSFDSLSLQVRQLVVELVGQRRQRPAARSADDYFLYQVTGQRVRQDSARHAQDIG